MNFFNLTVAKIIAAGVAAFSSLTAEAQFLDFTPGSCYDQSVVTPALEKDGQLMIASGKRAIPIFPHNIFTLNEKGYGYNFEQKKRLDKPSELCLRAAYKSALLNPPSNSTPPGWANAIKSNKGIDVEKAYKSNGRLLFVAQSYTRNAQGIEIGGRSVVIAFSNNKDNLASVWEVSSAGVPDSLFDMKDFQIMNFEYFIGRGFGSAPKHMREN